MKKIQWLTIRNFRGIKSLDLNDLGDINVFIGKNNTGKSTVLEAIYLNTTNGKLDLLQRDPFEIIFYRRGIQPHEFEGIFEGVLDTSPEYILSYLLFDASLKTQNEVTINSNIGEYILRIEQPRKSQVSEYVEGYNTVVELVRDLIEKLAQNKENADQLIETIQQLAVTEAYPEFSIVDSSGNYMLHIIKLKHHGSISYRLQFNTKTSEKSNVILIDEYFMKFRFGIEYAFPRFIKALDRIFNVDLKSLINFISIQLGKDVKDINEQLADFYITTQEDEVIPISLLGDGTKVSLVYFYILSGASNYILLEEPENHLHPSLMREVIKLMVDSAGNNQLFITTHSLEFLKELLKQANRKDSELKVFSFRDLKHGKPIVETYTLEEANAAINQIGVDLR